MSLEVIYEDDTSEVNAALAAAEKLVNQGLPLVMGAYSSSISGPLAQYFTRQQRPFLVFISADDAITRPGSPSACAAPTSCLPASRWRRSSGWWPSTNAG